MTGSSETVQWLELGPLYVRRTRSESLDSIGDWLSPTGLSGSGLRAWSRLLFCSWALEGLDARSARLLSVEWLRKLAQRDDPLAAGHRFAIVEGVLPRAPGDVEAQRLERVRMLERALCETLSRIVAYVGAEDVDTDPHVPFIAVVRTTGAAGEDLARKYSESPPAPGDWLPPVPPSTGPASLARSGLGSPKPVRNLAKALWLDLVGPRVERARRKPPALAMVVHEPVAHLFSNVRREEERDGQRALRLPGDVLVHVAPSASIGAGALNALMVERGLKLFGSIVSHRLLRWLIFTAHRQALERDPDPRVIHVDGGWSTIAHDRLRMKGKKAAEQARDLVEAMHATEMPLPPHGKYSRLLIREAHAPRGRGSHWVKLVLGTALLPDYVQELQRLGLARSLDGRRLARLVPVLEVPPMIGRVNEHGAQATFSMLLVAHMRDHAREIVQFGGIALDEVVLADLARRSGLPRDLATPLLDRWMQNGDDGPAFLKREGQLYTLGDVHSAQREFIEQGGRAELDGARAGERGARERRAKVQRAARRKSPV